MSNFLSSKGLIKEQIEKQAKYIDDVRKEIKERIQDPNLRFNFPYESDDEFFQRCANTISYHQRNIEKLKNGDFELCKKLIEQENKTKREMELLQKQIESLDPETAKLYQEGKLYISWRDDYQDTTDTVVIPSASEKPIKKVSKAKVGLCALLGYAVLNIIRNVLFAIVSIVVDKIGIKFIRYRLEDIAFFVAFYIGFMASSFIGEKLLKTEDAERRYNGTIGMLFIINYTYFIIYYFRYGEGKLFYLISSVLIGIYLFFSNRKKRS